MNTPTTYRGMKTYPKGTTKEQWDAYEIEKAEHEAYCEKIKPKKESFDFTGGESAYNNALNAWMEIKIMDAPNEPGYYRANND